MNQVEQLSDKNYVSVAPDSSVNYFEIAGRGANNSNAQTKETFHNWNESALDLGDYKVIPNGTNNDIPKQIQETTLPNSLAPRIQNRKVELLLDQGPYLYETKLGIRTPVDNPDILKWLENQDYREVLTANATDYYYSNAVFSKVFREVGFRIGDGNIAKLESLSSFDCRLAYHKNSKTKKPTHVIVGNWYGGNSSDTSSFQVYPLYNPLDPFKHPISIHFCAFKTYGMKYYPLPEIFGALEWIQRNTTIPKIIKALTDNSLNIKWHITSPQSYWDQVRKDLQEKHKNTAEKYSEKLFEDHRKKIFATLTELLSGVENVGKFWHNETVIKMLGASATKEGWEIKPIEQKIKDYVKAQLEIAFASAKAVLASLGLHSALANVGADGKSDSGAEQIYAAIIHQTTSTLLPEYYVCKAFNDCISKKFNTPIKLGFLRAKFAALEQTTPSKRPKNQTGD